LNKRYRAKADNGSGLIIRSAIDLVPGQVYLSKAGVPLEYPPSPNGLHDYIVQAHIRGKSVHLDLRIARDANYAEGWTILAQQSGVLTEPVTTLAEAKKWARDQRLWKFSLKTGKVMPRKIETTIQGRKRTIVRPGSLQAERKAEMIPKEWMKLEGIVPAGKDIPGEPVPAGATEQYPGVFVIIDKGKLTFGARKAYFFEYFIEQGKLLSGRIIFRLVSRAQVGKDLAWEQFRAGELFYEPEIGIMKQVLPTGKEPEIAREKVFWLFMTLDTEPYVLSHDAIAKAWLPPRGVAALPQGFQTKIPAKFRYWKMRKEAERLEARKGVVDLLKEKPIVKQETGTFRLLEQTYRGPISIRFGPSSYVYHLQLEQGEKRWVFGLDNDPRTRGGVVAYKENPDLWARLSKFGKAKEDVKPGTLLNPSKETPSTIRLIDSGGAKFTESTLGFLRIDFKGKEFSGAYLFREEEGTGLWEMTRSKSPVAKMTFLSKSTKKQIVFGVVLFPEEYGKDKQNDKVPQEEVELAAYRYLAFGRQIGFYHNDVAHVDFLLDENEPKSLVKKGEWYLGVWLPRSEDWARVESGEVVGFSIEGKAARERV